MESEATIVVQALRLNTLSKLTFADSRRFDCLVRDVFTDIVFKDVKRNDLRTALIKSIEDSKLIVSEMQVCKYYLLLLTKITSSAADFFFSL